MAHLEGPPVKGEMLQRVLGEVRVPAQHGLTWWLGWNHGVAAHKFCTCTCYAVSRAAVQSSRQGIVDGHEGSQAHKRFPNCPETHPGSVMPKPDRHMHFVTYESDPARKIDTESDSTVPFRNEQSESLTERQCVVVLQRHILPPTHPVDELPLSLLYPAATANCLRMDFTILLTPASRLSQPRNILIHFSFEQRRSPPCRQRMLPMHPRRPSPSSCRC